MRHARPPPEREKQTKHHRNSEADKPHHRAETLEAAICKTSIPSIKTKQPPTYPFNKQQIQRAQTRNQTPATRAKQQRRAAGHVPKSTAEHTPKGPPRRPTPLVAPSVSGYLRRRHARRKRDRPKIVKVF
jgi:hypothetical protein